MFSLFFHNYLDEYLPTNSSFFVFVFFVNYNIYLYFTTIFELLKGQSNEIFDPHVFSSFEPAWATDQWVNIFVFG